MIRLCLPKQTTLSLASLASVAYAKPYETLAQLPGWPERNFCTSESGCRCPGWAGYKPSWPGDVGCRRCCAFRDEAAYFFDITFGHFSISETSILCVNSIADLTKRQLFRRVGIQPCRF